MRAIAILLGEVSAFFIFYAVRLLVVTGFLQHPRVGGGGAYIGAVACPLFAIAFAWASVRCWRRAGRGVG